MATQMVERAKAAKIALVGVLGIALVIILTRQYAGGLSASEKHGVASVRRELPNSGQSQGTVDTAAPGTPVAANVRWKRPDLVGPAPRDPMYIELSKDEGLSGGGAHEEPNLAQTPAAAPEFRVAGIVFNADQPSSIIIDGHILHEGETIHGATVAKITKEHGILKRGEKSWIVKPGQANREPE